MKMQRVAAALVFTMFIAESAHPSGATVTYTYVAASPVYKVGGPIVSETVKLYVEESLTDGSASVLNQTGGVFGGGVQVALLSGSAFISNVTRNDADFAGPFFQTAVGGSSIFFLEGVAPGSQIGVPLGNTGGGASPGTHGNEVYLGAITIVPNPSVVSVFSVGPIPPIGGFTVDDRGDDLDLSNAAPAYVGAAALGNPPTTFAIIPSTFLSRQPPRRWASLESRLCAGEGADPNSTKNDRQSPPQPRRRFATL